MELGRRRHEQMRRAMGRTQGGEWTQEQAVSAVGERVQESPPAVAAVDLAQAMGDLTARMVAMVWR